MLEKSAVLRRCAKTRDAIFQMVSAALSPHLPDDTHLCILVGETTSPTLQLLTTSTDQVVWSVEYRYELASYDTHDGQHWMCASAALVATSATGERLETRVVFDNIESAVRDLCSRLLAYEPFVEYQWIRDAFDGMKFHLMADDRKVQTIWRISKASRQWATLMGVTCESKVMAMAEAMRSVRLCCTNQPQVELPQSPDGFIPCGPFAACPVL